MNSRRRLYKVRILDTEGNQRARFIIEAVNISAARKEAQLQKRTYVGCRVLRAVVEPMGYELKTVISKI